MKSVFLLQHFHILPDGIEDFKIIGIYTSKESALEAINRLKNQPGFADYPELTDRLTDQDEEGFGIDEYILDSDHWTEGYITI